MEELRTIKAVSGIGDNLWMFQKLVNCGEKFKIEIPFEDKLQRAKVLFDILPNLIDSYIYTDSFKTDMALKNNIQHKINKFKDIKEKAFYLTINKHLEDGHRIEKWLEDLPVTFNMSKHYATSQYINDVNNLLNNKNQKYIGIYMSTYNTIRAWKFWEEKEWVELMELVHNTDKDKYTFVFIGANYDLDTFSKAKEICDKKGIRTISTVGKNLGFVVETIKKLSYGFYFPSGIGILAASLYSPHTMFFPKHLDLMMNSFQAKELIDNNTVKHCQFCSPQEIFNWYKNEYRR